MKLLNNGEFYGKNLVFFNNCCYIKRNFIFFSKIWQATNDIGTIKNHLLGEPIKKQIEVSTKGVLIFSVIFLIAVALIARFGN